MIETLLKEIFNQPVEELIPLNKGLTNINTLAKVAGKWVVVHQPREDAASIVYFHHEAAALELIKDAELDKETLYFNPDTGIKITEYIEDFQIYDEYTGTDKLVRTALLMKKLHSLKHCIGYRFDPIGRYNQYFNKIKHPIYDLDFARDCITDAAAVQRPLTLCHNDWVSGNIGFSAKRDYLIDFEYAGDNDPLFDIMSFFTENKITDVKERELFYTSYFSRTPTADERRDLAIYEKLHNLLWCTWAMMMAESRNQAVYLDIAADKYNALKHNYIDQR